MTLDFNTMEESVFPNFLGGEGALRAKMYVDELGKILRGVLDPGCSIGYHTHETSSEIIYILSGTGKGEGGGRRRAGEGGPMPLLPQGERTRSDQRQPRAAGVFRCGAESIKEA